MHYKRAGLVSIGQIDIGEIDWNWCVYVAYTKSNLHDDHEAALIRSRMWRSVNLLSLSVFFLRLMDSLIAFSDWLIRLM